MMNNDIVTISVGVSHREKIGEKLADFFCANGV